MIFDLFDQYWIEFLAVVSAIVYLLLAVRQDIRCWFAAILSSFLYFFIMFSAGLYMEAGLQIFYILMAVYGWSQWREESTANIKLSVKTWKPINHLFSISLILLLAYASGIILEKFTNAVFPFIDALTTWGAIVATYMVAKKLLENWIYWFVIDSISIFLFMSRGLVLTSILFFIYLIIIYFGYKSWARIKDNGSIKPI